MSAAALSAVGLAACSSSSPPKADPSTAPAPVSSSAAPTGTPAPAGGSASPQASGPDVCSAVTGAKVAAITKDVIRTTARSQLGTGAAACTYTLSNSTIQVQVAPAGSGAAYADFSALVSNGAIPAGSALPVPGLGQQSVSSSFGVATTTGTWAILVVNQQGQVPGQLSADASIARAAISGLG
jgi:hypothetical protein